jgi:hypothetical protein
LAVPFFLSTIEQSGIAKAIRESLFGFYFLLTIHTVGLSLVVGPNAVIDLRLLGVARSIPLAPLKRLYTLIWLGLGLNVTSGLLLVLAYPVKAFTNPDFYIKLTLIAFAVWTMWIIKNRVLNDSSLSEDAMLVKGKALAWWSLVLWVGVIAAGRLLAYTCTYLLYGVPC